MSPPRGLMLSPSPTPSATTSPFVCSTGTTASAPSGTTAPVEMAIASPASSMWSDGLPAADWPTADRQRFQREARAAAALSHPNIAAVYDYGEAEGRPYMVLEHLPNGSLEDRLKSGALPDEETRRIATEIAAGLAHAHERGLVH